MAKQVIAGEYGNGEVRKQKLGDKYYDVQKRVNEMLGYTSKEQYYTVQKGDCLCNIAKKFGTSVQTIAKLNGITNVDFIRTGERLRIR